MKLPFSLFLAFKYLKPKRSMVSIITVLTMLGIMLGVAVLIIVLSVMTGFDDVHKEHMIALDSHIQVAARGQSASNATSALYWVDKQFVSGSGPDSHVPRRPPPLNH